LFLVLVSDGEKEKVSRVKPEATGFFGSRERMSTAPQSPPRERRVALASVDVFPLRRESLQDSILSNRP
jgi:hypothetical protein